ncbi:MAG: YvrJ family protein [Acidobacteriota bacterium]
MPDLYEFVRNFGFPGAVAFFLLWRVEGRLREIREQIAMLNVRLVLLLDRSGPRPPGPE